MTQTETKSRPILFSLPMIRAILAGHKTQTRRPVKIDADGCYYTVTNTAIVRHPHNAETILRDVKRPFEVGMRLWVKEKYSVGGNGAFYADQSDGTVHVAWRSPRFMPRKYSRIALEVIGVRVERVHRISDADVVAEGVDQLDIDKNRPWFHKNDVHALAFAELWQKVNGKRPGCGWKDNPWVWAITFRRLP